MSGRWCVPILLLASLIGPIQGNMKCINVESDGRAEPMEICMESNVHDLVVSEDGKEIHPANRAQSSSAYTLLEDPKNRKIYIIRKRDAYSDPKKIPMVAGGKNVKVVPAHMKTTIHKKSDAKSDTEGKPDGESEAKPETTPAPESGTEAGTKPPDTSESPPDTSESPPDTSESPPTTTESTVESTPPNAAGNPQGNPGGNQGGAPQGNQGGYPQGNQGGYPQGNPGGNQGGYPPPGNPGGYPGENQGGYPPPGNPGGPQGYPPPGNPGGPQGYPPPGNPGPPQGYPPPGNPGGPQGYPPPGNPGPPQGYPPPGNPGGPQGYPPPGNPGGPQGYPPPGNPGGYPEAPLQGYIAGNPGGYPGGPPQGYPPGNPGGPPPQGYPDQVAVGKPGAYLPGYHVEGVGYVIPYEALKPGEVPAPKPEPEPTPTKKPKRKPKPTYPTKAPFRPITLSYNFPILSWLTGRTPVRPTYRKMHSLGSREPQLHRQTAHSKKPPDTSHSQEFSKKHAGKRKSLRGASAPQPGDPNVVYPVEPYYKGRPLPAGYWIFAPDAWYYDGKPKAAMHAQDLPAELKNQIEKS